ncbi:1047_t:CDS:2, partial [Scutellospora calospora]
NIKNNYYSSKNKELMYELLEANTFKRVDEIFDELKASDKLNINSNYTNKAPDNTNIAEASHTNINCDGKALSLENAIL